MNINKPSGSFFEVLSASDILALPDPNMTYPIIIDDQPVKVQGETLKQIWWQGKQWAVTEYGIECRDGTYAIKAQELTYDLLNGTKHGWVEQMLSKGWCDMDDFRTAYFVALSMHGCALSDQQNKKLRRHFIKP
jgi:hypothetical protein